MNCDFVKNIYPFEQPSDPHLQVFLRRHHLFRHSGGLFVVQAAEDDPVQPVHPPDPDRQFCQRHLLFQLWSLYQRTGESQCGVFFYTRLSPQQEKAIRAGQDPFHYQSQPLPGHHELYGGIEGRRIPAVFPLFPCHDLYHQL